MKKSVLHAFIYSQKILTKKAAAVKETLQYIYIYICVYVFIIQTAHCYHALIYKHNVFPQLTESGVYLKLLR